MVGKSSSSSALRSKRPSVFFFLVLLLGLIKRSIADVLRSPLLPPPALLPHPSSSIGGFHGDHPWRCLSRPLAEDLEDMCGNERAISPTFARCYDGRDGNRRRRRWRMKSGGSFRSSFAIVSRSLFSSSSLASSSPNFVRSLCLLRGGAEVNGDGESIADDDDNDNDEAFASFPRSKTGAIGVLDLRPDPVDNSDSDMFSFPLRRQRQRQDYLLRFRNDGEIDSSGNHRPPLRASFPNDIFDDAVISDEQAAAALTIGSNLRSNGQGGDCDGHNAVVVLVVAYDFTRGATVLHRTAGGVKLLNLVDGMRFQNDDGHGRNGIKLVLLLVPFSRPVSEDGVENEDTPHRRGDGDSDQTSSWNDAGATLLGQRLEQYFELGGSGKEDSVDSAAGALFKEVEFIPLWRTAAAALMSIQGEDTTENDDDDNVANAISGLIQRSISEGRRQNASNERDENGGITENEALHDDGTIVYKELLQGSFEKMGGAGRIAFVEERNEA